MCWNAPVSLATFITSVIMCAYLWQRNIANDKPFALFIFWFSFMQLFEFFMWRDMKGHTFVSKLSLIFILLQPLSLVGGLYYFRPTLYKELWEKLVLLGIGLISLIKTAVATFYAFIIETKGKWLSVKGPHCHLIWWFTRHNKLLPLLSRANTSYCLLLLASMLMIKPFSYALIWFIFSLLSCLYTMKYFPHESGSLWCWIATFLGFLAIAAPYLS